MGTMLREASLVLPSKGRSRLCPSLAVPVFVVALRPFRGRGVCFGRIERRYLNRHLPHCQSRQRLRSVSLSQTCFPPIDRSNEGGSGLYSSTQSGLVWNGYWCVVCVLLFVPLRAERDVRDNYIRRAV